jgi:death-on-curing family protein
MKNKKITKQTLVYQAKDGAIELKLDKKDETILANLNQIAELFGVQKAAISKHLSNIFKEGELENDSVVSILETTASDGKNYKVSYYNLDAIISVGYRVNSKQATNFRIWATKTLKKYLTNGVAINKKLISQNHQKFLKAIEDIKTLSQDSKNLKAGDILDLIKSFSYTWFSLDSFDKGEFPKQGTKKSIAVDAKELEQDIAKLKAELMVKKEATAIFATEKNQGTLEGILGNVFQSAFGEDVYPSLEEKAAHLLYFIVKNHPFNDGNKRSGAFAFIWFLRKSGLQFLDRISPETLASLTILIAESNPKEKDKMVGLVVMLLKREEKSTKPNTKKHD